MDDDKLIRRCEAITLKSEEENMISFAGRMKTKGEKVVVHCLIGKILHARNVAREGLKAAMQLAWRSTKELKVESLGDNIFVFKFASASEKKRVLYGGPWHFDRSLMILAEPIGVGDTKKQNFTHTSFWVQIHNLPIMCMDKEIVQEIRGKIGKVEEVETDEAGECIGSYARIRVSVDVTKPLTKRLVLKVGEGEQLSMRVAYERLPEFCFCCGRIGHQYKECLDYKGQPKDELAFGVWMRAQTKAEQLRQNRDTGRWRASNAAPEKNGSQAQPGEEMGQPNPRRENVLGSTPPDLEKNIEPMRSGQVKGPGKGSLIKNDDMVQAIAQPQTVAATEMGIVPKTERTIAGKNEEKRRENEMHGESGAMDLLGLDTSKNEMGCEQGIELNHTSGQNTRARRKKWKLQARERALTGKCVMGPASLKRAMRDQVRPSPECKKLKLGSPVVSWANQIHISSPTAKLKLVWEKKVHVLTQNEGMVAENVSAEAGKQPRRQP